MLLFLQVRIRVNRLPVYNGEEYKCVFANVELDATVTVSEEITCPPLSEAQVPALPRDKGQ